MYEYLLNYLQKIEANMGQEQGALNKRIDELVTMGFNRRAESVEKFDDANKRINAIYNESEASAAKFNDLNQRLIAIQTNGTGSDEKFKEIDQNIAAIQAKVDLMRGDTQASIDKRLEEADLNISAVLAKQRKTMEDLTAAEEVIKTVTEQNFVTLYQNIEIEVGILKDRAQANSIEIEQCKLEVHNQQETAGLHMAQAMNQVTLDIAQQRQQTAPPAGY